MNLGHAAVSYGKQDKKEEALAKDHFEQQNNTTLRVSG
jgi:hypothetical protein